jgi:hypothetical protein
MGCGASSQADFEVQPLNSEKLVIRNNDILEKLPKFHETSIRRIKSFHVVHTQSNNNKNYVKHISNKMNKKLLL